MDCREIQKGVDRKIQIDETPSDRFTPKDIEKFQLQEVKLQHAKRFVHGIYCLDAMKF